MLRRKKVSTSCHFFHAQSLRLCATLIFHSAAGGVNIFTRSRKVAKIITKSSGYLRPLAAYFPKGILDAKEGKIILKTSQLRDIPFHKLIQVKLIRGVLFYLLKQRGFAYTMHAFVLYKLVDFFSQQPVSFVGVE